METPEAWISTNEGERVKQLSSALQEAREGEASATSLNCRNSKGAAAEATWLRHSAAGSKFADRIVTDRASLKGSLLAGHFRGRSQLQR